MFDLISYFTDPVLRAPMIGCLAMAITSALIGVPLVLRRQSLIGEVICHTAFPGVVLGVLISAPFLSEGSEGFSIVLLSFAFVFSLLGIWLVQFLQKRCRIPSDATFCFVLSLFFGIGVLVASRIQVLQTAWYKQALIFLFGQAATMTDRYLPVYGFLTLATIVVVISMYPRIQSVLFDKTFATSTGIKIRSVELCLTLLVALAVVIGMRSMGVVLMAGMLIAPAVAARPWCAKLHSCLILSSAIAVFSAFFGNVLSVEGTKALVQRFPEWQFSLPTGPVILLVAAACCFFSLLFAPQGGAVSRFWKKRRFKHKIRTENLLKALWKKGKGACLNKQELCRIFPNSGWLLFYARNKGWIQRCQDGDFQLSPEGWARACHIVRLHRLWEVYLVEYMSQGVDRVHRSAEELEHIMDKTLEQELEDLLGNLKADPHSQPIPSREEARW